MKRDKFTVISGFTPTSGIPNNHQVPVEKERSRFMDINVKKIVFTLLIPFEWYKERLEDDAFSTLLVSACVTVLFVGAGSLLWTLATADERQEAWARQNRAVAQQYMDICIKARPKADCDLAVFEKFNGVVLEAK